MVMITVNIFEAKAKLSEYVEAVSRGERVVICNRNRPVAELRAIKATPATRTLGTASGAFEVPDSFFDPLPEDLLDAFEGRAPSPTLRVAESPATHGPQKSKKRR